MATNANLVNDMVGTLENRVLTISNSIIEYNKNGIVPNKNLKVGLDWCSILIAAYDNVRALSDEQEKELNSLYRKVITI